MKYSGNLPETNVNVTEKSPLKEATTLVVGLLLFIFIIYWILGIGIDFAVKNLTPQQEKVLSLKMGGEFTSMEHDNEISSVLQKIIDPLQNKCADLPYKVNVFAVYNKDVNAVALPGGTVLVFSGLLNKVDSENELAFILAHELGHFKNKDHLRGMGRAIVLMTLYSMLLGGNNDIDEILASFLTFTESAHSRKQESEADAAALKIVQCHYGHVGGSTKFFEGALKEKESSTFAHFVASHPTDTQRIKDIENQISQLGYKKEAVIKFEKN